MSVSCSLIHISKEIEIQQGNIKCFHAQAPVYFKENMTCSASYAVTILVLFLFNSISLCFGCTSDKHGETINILKCFAEPGLTLSSSRFTFQVFSSLKRRFDFS